MVEEARGDALADVVVVLGVASELNLHPVQQAHQLIPYVSRPLHRTHLGARIPDRVVSAAL
eukprot:421170-Pyramimonas_sp.AAC.1